MSRFKNWAEKVDVLEETFGKLSTADDKTMRAVALTALLDITTSFAVIADALTTIAGKMVERGGQNEHD